MAIGWQVLDMAAFSGRLTVRHKSVYAGDVCAAAIDDLSGVILGPEVLANAAALARLAENGVAVAIEGHAGRTPATLMSVSGHDRVAARHRAQAEAGAPVAKRLWQQIVKSKITAQADNLAVPASEQLTAVARSVRSGDSTNAEGRAARIYWQALRPSPGWRRDQDGRDRWNASLNYGYGILRNHMYSAIFAAGLWPTHGVFHRHRSNPGCLVDDLMEPFRPLIDRIVFVSLEADELESVAARRSLAAALELEAADGQKVRAALNGWAQAVGSYFETPQDGVPSPPSVQPPRKEPRDGRPADVDHADV